MVYSTDRSKAVVPVLVLLFVALWFILRGDLLYVLPCVILFLCFSVLLALRLLCLGKRELILVLFVRLFDLRLFGFISFLFLLVSGKGCGLWLWHSLDFSLTSFFLHEMSAYFRKNKNKNPIQCMMSNIYMINTAQGIRNHFELNICFTTGVYWSSDPNLYLYIPLCRFVKCNKNNRMHDIIPGRLFIC